MDFRYPITENAELRLLEPRHADEMYALVEQNREHLGRWLSWVASRRSVTGTAQYITQCLQRFAEDGSPLCGIWSHGKLAGVIDLLGIGARSRCAEIGYWLDAGSQRRGLITQACHALVNHAFNVLAVNRIEIRAEPANTRSRAVPERLGFTMEGTLRQVINMGDRFADRVVYAMLRKEWPADDVRLIFAYPLTADIELRLLQPCDADTLYILTDKNRAHLQPWMPWIDSTTSVDVSRGFIRHALQTQAECAEYHWAICYQGQLAGIIGTLPINWASRKAEIGYWLGEEFAGKGVMTRAGQAMLTFLFTTLNLNRVEIRCDVRNNRSRAVAERLGFTHEGIQRQSLQVGEQLVDLHTFSLLREEWEVRAAAVQPVGKEALR